jgi:hypothetical protein
MRSDTGLMLLLASGGWGTRSLSSGANHKDGPARPPPSWSFEPCDWTRPERHSIVHVV